MRTRLWLVLGVLTLGHSAGCATTSHKARSDAQAFLDLEGTEVIDAPEPAARAAAANALATLGYAVVVNEPGVVATAPRVIHSSTVGVGVTDGTIGAAVSSESANKRAMELRLEALPDGRTRVRAVPRLLYGQEETDLSDVVLANHLNRSPEQQHLRELFRTIRHFVEIRAVESTTASGPVMEAGTMPAVDRRD